MIRVLLPLFLLACHPAEDPEPIDVWSPPDSEGTFLAGTLDDSFVGSEDLALTVQVWFPASEGDTDFVEYDGLMLGGAVEDGVPACDVPRPAVVFSHGNGGIRFQSFFLTEHLARHGYVVVAPDHDGNTLYGNDLPRGELALRRPRDVTDSFDWLAAQAADPASPLFGCIDPDAGFAMTGHSFGGYTTLAVAGAPLDLDALASHCAADSDLLCGAETAWAESHPDDASGDLSDSRAWAAVPLAPAGAIALVESGIEVPTLAIGGIEDGLTTWQDQLEPIYAGLTTEERALAGIVDAGHYTFTNLCTSGFDGCGDGAIDTDLAYGLIQTMTLAWIDVARGESRSAEWLPPGSDAVEWYAP
ncbi:MAG: hypothetical protein EP330_05005 [Deltaproteobacteria bacterium]|nr:MAG: hypothetical protein EP330_05005 [Deltaproteobacteria bacterium]